MSGTASTSVAVGVGIGGGEMGYGGYRAPFTAVQWQELEHQAMIYKYLVAGLPVPPDLVMPIRRSFEALSARFFHHPSCNNLILLLYISWATVLIMERNLILSLGDAEGQMERSGGALKTHIQTPNIASGTCTVVATVQESLWNPIYFAAHVNCDVPHI
ncbi:UNVERIFIED_CONTAM: Growth-regulating factor 4 [Sesamum radiatum]|uniref:Growth-regulating factor n=1 Tax=Sesamum radiatum TaxID=300843 RepID=A0AAW2KZH8_SESRA